jgi:hypothetical protein
MRAEAEELEASLKEKHSSLHSVYQQTLTLSPTPPPPSYYYTSIYH